MFMMWLERNWILHILALTASQTALAAITLAVLYEGVYKSLGINIWLSSTTTSNWDFLSASAVFMLPSFVSMANDKHREIMSAYTRLKTSITQIITVLGKSSDGAKNINNGVKRWIKETRIDKNNIKNIGSLTKLYGDIFKDIQTKGDDSGFDRAGEFMEVLTNIRDLRLYAIPNQFKHVMLVFIFMLFSLVIPYGKAQEMGWNALIYSSLIGFVNFTLYSMALRTSNSYDISGTSEYNEINRLFNVDTPVGIHSNFNEVFTLYR